MKSMTIVYSTVSEFEAIRMQITCVSNLTGLENSGINSYE